MEDNANSQQNTLETVKTEFLSGYVEYCKRIAKIRLKNNNEPKAVVSSMFLDLLKYPYTTNDKKISETILKKKEKISTKDRALELIDSF